MLLLYAIGQVYKCKIYCFPTRAKLEIIVPKNFDNTNSIPSFAVLKHCNSYLGKTVWYVLDVDNSPIGRSCNDMDVDQTITAEDAIYAKKKKRDASDKKSRLGRRHLGRSLNDHISSLLREETFSKSKTLSIASLKNYVG